MAENMKIQENPIFDYLDQNGVSSSPPSPLSPLSTSISLSQRPIFKDKPSNLSSPVVNVDAVVDDDGFQKVVYNRRAIRKNPASNFQGNIPRKPENARNSSFSGRTVSRNNNTQSRNVFRQPMNSRNQISTVPASIDTAQRMQKASSWADLLKRGGLDSEFDLHYVAPININDKKFVTVKEDIDKRTENKWSNSVIAYVYGPRPPYHHFKTYITRNWNPKGSFEIYTRNNGFFIIRFTKTEDCEKSLNGGPYFINGKLIILKKWSKKFNFDRDLLTSMPIWIRLPELSLRLWDKDAFSAIASLVGMPLKLDEPTAKETRLSYARILVEIKADAELPNEANITMYDGDSMVQKIEYEWIPPRCKSCKCFGHSVENCTVKKVWKEICRENDITVEVNAEEISNAVLENNVQEAHTTVIDANKTSHVANQENMQYKSSYPPQSTDVGETVLLKASVVENPITDASVQANTEEDIMNIEHTADLNFAELIEPPKKTDLSFLSDSLSPIKKKALSRKAIQTAVKTASSPPADKKERRKKARTRIKSLNDISSAEQVEDTVDKEFREKYISKNDKWGKLLKVKSDSTYKKKGKKLEVQEDDDSYCDSL
jgi:hypothetical protein